MLMNYKMFILLEDIKCYILMESNPIDKKDKTLHLKMATLDQTIYFLINGNKLQSTQYEKMI